MKRLERYAAQLQLLQEAAFAVVRREGVGSLSRRALAAELGAAEAMARRTLGDHVRLPALAAAECAARRRRVPRQRRHPLDLLLPGPHPVDATAVEGDRAAPDPRAEIDVEVVWLRLLLTHATAAVDDSAMPLAERYQLAVHDRLVEQPRVERDRSSSIADAEAVAGYVEEWDEARRSLVTRLVGDRDELVEPVLALVDGLVLALCRGRTTSEEARRLLVGHLAALGCPVEP